MYPWQDIIVLLFHPLKELDFLFQRRPTAEFPGFRRMSELLSRWWWSPLSHRNVFLHSFYLSSLNCRLFIFFSSSFTHIPLHLFFLSIPSHFSICELMDLYVLKESSGEFLQNENTLLLKTFMITFTKHICFTITCWNKN